MAEALFREPDPFDITVTATAVTRAAAGFAVLATVENGTGADGCDVELRVTSSAERAYGLAGCVLALERFLNATLRPEFRLGAALAMSADGPFIVGTDPAGPRVLPPAAPAARDLAA